MESSTEIVVIRRRPGRRQTGDVRGQTSGITGQASDVSPDSLPPTADAGPLPSEPDPRPPAERLSAERRRELEEIADLIRCDVRTRVLLDLADPAGGGPANVGTLARRTDIEPPDKLSSHLGKLKDLGLLFCQRKGKEKWYEINPDRVRYERTETGAARLTITARTTGIEVTISIPAAAGIGGAAGGQ